MDNQKKGVPLASTSLATHVFSDLQFFNFLTAYLNECVSQFVNDYEATSSQSQQVHLLNGLNFAFSFLTKCLLQSIKQLAVASGDLSARKNRDNKQQEAFFAQLLPVLFDGFKSDILAYKQMAYLVCAFLFEKFTFTVETSNKALFAICKGMLFLFYTFFF